MKDKVIAILKSSSEAKTCEVICRDLSMNAMSISLAELKNLIYENNEVFEFTTDLRVKLRKGEIEPVPTFKLRKGEIEPVPAFIASDLQVKLKEGEMEPDPAFIEGI